jgi:hypothetical protein
MLDAALLRLAGRQHGLVTARQLASLGFTKDRIFRRLQAGVLFRVHRGVYAVAGSRDTFDFRVLAAVLAAGDGALASHRCAAALFGLRRIRCDTPEVTVSGRNAPRIAVPTHRRDVLTRSDRTRLGVIPVTAPPWTLLDLAAAGIETSRVAGAVDDVIVRNLASAAALERFVARTSREGLPGAGLLAELVAARRAGTKPSETGLEDELLEVFRAYGLPEPVRQFVLPLPGGGTARFDAAYPDLLLGFEADGDAFHKGLLDRMRDEARDERCGLIGWTVRRYSTEDIRERAAGIADEVERLRRTAAAA